jgi:serine/threonine protein phosphatase PrpC
VQEALETVHDRLVAASSHQGISGTTAVVLLASDDHVAAVWAGDSRVYRWRAGRLDQLTRDHSLVQEMVDQGQLSPEEARRHPWRNRITSAIGAGDTWRHEVAGDHVEAGDRYLLCSDGLTECVTDDAIAATLAEPDPATVVQRLIEQTLAAGAPDNVTVVVVAAEAASGGEEPDRDAPTRIPQRHGDRPG